MSTQCCISCRPYRSIRKQMWPCHKKWSRSTQGHHLKKKNGGSQVRCCIPSFKIIGLLVPKKKIFEVLFLPYMGMVVWSGKFEQIFILHIPWRLSKKFGFIGLAISLEKKFENVDSEWPWTMVNEWPWPRPCIHLFDYNYQLSPQRIHQSLGSLQFMLRLIWL